MSDSNDNGHSLPAAPPTAPQLILTLRPDGGLDMRGVNLDLSRQRMACYGMLGMAQEILTRNAPAPAPVKAERNSGLVIPRIHVKPS